MGTTAFLIHLTIWITHLIVSRSLCKSAAKRGKKGLSYDAWWSWFIPPIGIIWAFLDYATEPTKYNGRTWFNGKYW